MQLTTNEELELKYMQALGMKWIAKDEDTGTVFAYENRPKRMAGEDCAEWRIDDGDFEVQRIGEYDFLNSTDQPMEIDKILMENGWDVPLVEPK